MQQLAPDALNEWLNDTARPQPVLLDVRETWEFETCRLPESTHVPMNTIPQRFAELDPAADTVVICHHGARSMQVGFFLERQGFAKIFNLAGGVDAWAQTVDSNMARY